MPYIETTSNVSIPGRKEQVIKDRMGDAIEKIPGKTESWLMLSFRDNAAMYFKGTDAPCAICQVKLFGGSATEEDYAALTEALTDILREELDIDSDRIYVTYEEIWGKGKVCRQSGCVSLFSCFFRPSGRKWLLHSLSALWGVLNVHGCFTENL